MGRALDAIAIEPAAAQRFVLMGTTIVDRENLSRDRSGETEAAPADLDATYRSRSQFFRAEDPRTAHDSLLQDRSFTLVRSCFHGEAYNLPFGNISESACAPRPCSLADWRTVAGAGAG